MKFTDIIQSKTELWCLAVRASLVTSYRLEVQ